MAEEASISRAGIFTLLRELFPAEVRGISETNGLAVHVDPNVSREQEQEILATTRLLMACDVPSLVITRERPPSAELVHARVEAEATYQRLAEETAWLHDRLPDVLTVDALELPALPDRSSTYASVHDGVCSLIERLALFERVYVYMPFTVENFRDWAGCSIREFLDVLPTGRVVPVFGQAVGRYEAGLMTRILEVAPRAILHGEHTLRAVRASATSIRH